MNLKRGQKVRIVKGTVPAHRTHPNDPDLVGLEGVTTGRHLNGMAEVTLPFPGTGKPFGFLVNVDEVEAL